MKIYSVLSEKKKDLWVFTKYILGCACSLAIKLTANACFVLFPLWLSYLCAQGFVLIFSYFYHSRVTFAYKSSSRKDRAVNIAGFILTMFSFMSLDYLLVVFGVKIYLAGQMARMEDLSLWQKHMISFVAIVIVTLFLFFIRFFCFRVLFRRKNHSTN